LTAVTAIFPLLPAKPVITVNEVEPSPNNIDHPSGTVHKYVVAPATAEIEYT
jgi:hypothetical protein